jgi:CheY-like chemotaxis protein
VPPDKVSEIFGEFRRLDTQAHGRDRGVGLGLAIVDRASRMLGHPVTVRSTEGRGSVFAIEVPLGDRQPRPIAASIAAPTSPLSDARILVIDNEPAILEGMVALLRGWGCEVAVASCQEDALRVLVDLRGPPDVVVADYHLENGAVGVDAIDAIRRACGAATPGMVITADRAPQVYDAAAARGLQILNKPVKPARLRAALTQLLP